MLKLKAQASRVLVQNDFNHATELTMLLLRGYNLSLYDHEGVKFYRKESGKTDWIKLNEAHVLRYDLYQGTSEEVLRPFTRKIKDFDYTNSYIQMDSCLSN